MTARRQPRDLCKCSNYAITSWLATLLTESLAGVISKQHSADATTFWLHQMLLVCVMLCWQHIPCGVLKLCVWVLFACDHRMRFRFSFLSGPFLWVPCLYCLPVILRFIELVMPVQLSVVHSPCAIERIA
jgi:hypothetical protein